MKMHENSKSVLPIRPSVLSRLHALVSQCCPLPVPCRPYLLTGPKEDVTSCITHGSLVRHPYRQQNVLARLPSLPLSPLPLLPSTSVPHSLVPPPQAHGPFRGRAPPHTHAPQLPGRSVRHRRARPLVRILASLLDHRATSTARSCNGSLPSSSLSLAVRYTILRHRGFRCHIEHTRRHAQSQGHVRFLLYRLRRWAASPLAKGGIDSNRELYKSYNGVSSIATSGVTIIVGISRFIVPGHDRRTSCLAGWSKAGQPCCPCVCTIAQRIGQVKHPTVQSVIRRRECVEEKVEPAGIAE